MRTVLIGFVIVLLILSCGLAIRYGYIARDAEKQLNNERYQRLVSEENLQKANERVDSLKAELSKVQEKVAQVEGVLEKTKAINEDLRVRLDKAAEIKLNLDKRIEELQRLVLPM
ncbi:MAG: hypothetical protein JW847_07195 [Candidatus Omnitrophica bacterium]|nr:hypothetical protein [Candidatus Omnitrophota bacterium]